MHGLIHSVQKPACDDPFVTRLGGYIDLTPADLNALNLLIESEQTIKKRRDLVVDGYEFCKLCFVKDGFAARYKLLRNGKRQIINVVMPGDVIGLPGSFLERASFSVIALTDMTLQVCALDDFIGLCYRRPKFGVALSWLAVHEATTCAEHVISIGRRTSLERLAHFLLEVHARLAMVGHATSSGFDLPFSQEIMSDALGLSVPHLNRMLARLRTEGMIAINERHVTFLDIKGMELLAHFQPLNLTRAPTPPQEARVSYRG
ncbi:MAG: Crp/Fnr family transcriptional regulator [Rhizobiales bacterium]|jgi:CRP-like cAMP-binding protein|nr:Crp/Fnr family transcriptional regulator [Hyphomicrobiales bacterium]